MTAAVQVQWDTASFISWADAGQKRLEVESTRALDKAAAVAKGLAPSRFKTHTGTLTKSIGTQRVSAFKVNVRAEAPYAGYVENGTRAHDIPARGGALRFTVNGTLFFRRVVHHKGTAPTHFLSAAVEDVRPYLHQLLVTAVEDIFG